MSIESDLNRIATALEEMVKICRSNIQAEVVPAPALKAAEPVKKVKKEVPVVQPEPDTDPFGQEVSTQPEPTFESLTSLLKAHSIALGTKVTIALIIKHGADRMTPKLNTIPQASFSACYAEAKADLAKLEVKSEKR